MSNRANFWNLTRESLFTVQNVLLKEQRFDSKPAERKYLRINFNTGFLEVKNLQNSDSLLLSRKRFF